MATSTNIYVSSENTGLWNIQQTDEAAQKASELMQRDLLDHHVYLNNLGFHDHVPHHILALYGTGASAQQMEYAYNLRDPLQRPTQHRHDDVIAELNASWENAAHYLGKEDYYPDFLFYFQAKIDALGYEEVVRKYLFSEDPPANDLLVRLFAGVVHPLIQLMYGLEWKQPAVVAEALAQTCIHVPGGLDELLPLSEERARGAASEYKMPPLLTFYESIRDDRALANAVRVEDGADKIQGGILSRAKDEMLAILQQVRVGPDEVDERTAEMLHTIIFVGSSAAIHPPHHVKYDFSLMHHINSALINLTINEEAWIPVEVKARMLEWKIRMDLLEYAAQGCPALSLERITSYVPKTPSETNESIREIGMRLHDFGDDGHGIKQTRATAIGHELTKAFKDKPWVILRDDSTWRIIQHMVVDSLEGPGVLYVRGAGLDQVWQDVPPQSAPRRDPQSLRALQTGSGSSKEALKSYSQSI